MQHRRAPSRGRQVLFPFFWAAEPRHGVRKARPPPRTDGRHVVGGFQAPQGPLAELLHDDSMGPRTAGPPAQKAAGPASEGKRAANGTVPARGETEAPTHFRGGQGPGRVRDSVEDTPPLRAAVAEKFVLGLGGIRPRDFEVPQACPCSEVEGSGNPMGNQFSPLRGSSGGALWSRRQKAGDQGAGGLSGRGPLETSGKKRWPGGEGEVTIFPGTAANCSDEGDLPPIHPTQGQQKGGGTEVGIFGRPPFSKTGGPVQFGTLKSVNFRGSSGGTCRVCLGCDGERISWAAKKTPGSSGTGGMWRNQRNATI